MSNIRTLQGKVSKLESAPGFAPPLRVKVLCLTGTQEQVDQLNADQAAANLRHPGVHVTHALQLVPVPPEGLPLTPPSARWLTGYAAPEQKVTSH